MKNFQDYIIRSDEQIIEAMRKLNDLPETLTLFVVDSSQHLLGTLTDGDIRRGFIQGYKLSDIVSRFMTSKFKSIRNDFSVNDYKNARDAGVRLLPIVDENTRITKVIDVNKRKSILPLECLIIAGGRGERLRPLTDKIPKPMLLLGGKPILEHIIEHLVSYGIEKIYIAIRYLGQQIVDHFGDGSSRGIIIEYIWEDKPLGTAGALSLLGKINTDMILIMNSDLFTDADLEDLYLNVLHNHADIGVASVIHTVKVPYGIFEGKEKFIGEFKEKPIFTNYANAGIYILKKQLIKKIPSNTYYDITDLLNMMIDHEYILIHNPIIGYWIDIGQHQDFSNAKEIFKHQGLK